MKSLKESAMLIRPSLSMWTARKFDKKVTAEVNDQYGSIDAGRWNKLLVAHERIKTMTRLKGDFWTEHYYRTVPWSKDGWALLSIKGYWDYMEWVGMWKTRWEGRVWQFAIDFPDMVKQAEERLNGMFNPKDYPPADEIMDRFKFELDYNTVAQWDGTHLAVDLRDDELDRVSKLMEAKANERLATAMNDVWQRLYNQVKHIAERLSGPDNVFRDSLIGNVVGLVNILPTLNITDDPNLEKMRRDVERTLARQDPQMLRDDMDKRAEVKKDADAILSAMSGYIGT